MKLLQKKYGWVSLIIFSVLTLSLKDSLEGIHLLLHQIPNSVHFHEADEEHGLGDHTGEEDHDDPFHKIEKNPFKSVVASSSFISVPFFAPIQRIFYKVVQENTLRSGDLPSIFCPPRKA